MEGVYTISTVPTMNPPPTHVATGRINTARHLQRKQQLTQNIRWELTHHPSETY